MSSLKAIILYIEAQSDCIFPYQKMYLYMLHKSLELPLERQLEAGTLQLSVYLTT